MIFSYNWFSFSIDILGQLSKCLSGALEIDFFELAKVKFVNMKKSFLISWQKFCLEQRSFLLLYIDGPFVEMLSCATCYFFLIKN